MTATPPRDPRIVLVSFGDGQVFRNSIARLRREAQESGWFDDVRVRTPADLDPSFWDAERRAYAKVRVRGHGNWSWKPRVILDAIETAEDGDVVVYLDVGCSLNSKAAARFADYVDFALKAPAGILCFRLPHLPELAWTKSDTVDAVCPEFAGEGRREALNTGQILSGILFFRKCAESMAVLRRWQYFMESRDRHLIDDSPSRAPNHPSFQEHRHDQSIMSLLLRTTAGVAVLDDETFAAPNWQRDGAAWPIWATRLR